MYPYRCACIPSYLNTHECAHICVGWCFIYVYTYMGPSIWLSSIPICVYTYVPTPMCVLRSHICVHIYDNRYMIIIRTHICVHIYENRYMIIVFPHMSTHIWVQVYGYFACRHMLHTLKLIYGYRHMIICLYTYMMHVYDHMSADIWSYTCQAYETHMCVSIYLHVGFSLVMIFTN